jgi:fatty acid desaturase
MTAASDGHAHSGCGEGGGFVVVLAGGRRPGYYAWKITVTTALFAAGWALFAMLGDSWWQLAVAVFLAGLFTQVGFLGHDAGHRQILRSRRANYILGVLHGNLASG